MPAVVPSGQQRPPGPAKAKPPSASISRDEDDEETTTDDSSDEEAAFEMDGQELWTQTYCATCDCLIEPGEGVSKSEPSRASHTSLKSRSGTIKARNNDGIDANTQSGQGTHVNRDGTASNSGNKSAELKRTNSAGRIHARGTVGPLGPHKRTGSAGSRLNALSELKPTTKLHPTHEDVKGKGKATSQDGKGPGRRSPAMSRRSSTASVKSLNQGNSGPGSERSDETSNPGSTAKPKSKGFLGGLTPAALRQQQAELAEKKRAPSQLYCSERCRQIDQDRAAELTQYLSQPLQSAGQAAWTGSGWPVGPSASHWPGSTCLSSVSIPYVDGTSESECMCPECMDKYIDGASASGATVPSGASDTTESSGGYVYGRPLTGQKARTASGRIVTPLNLYPPGGSAAADSYFPIVGGPVPQNKRNSMVSLRSRQGDGAGGVDVDSSHRVNQPPHRTSSAGPVGSASTADTESSSSHVSLWEPKLKRPTATSGSGTIRRASPAERSERGRDVDAAASARETFTSGRDTVTGTPAITPRQSIMESAPPANKDDAREVTIPTAASMDARRDSRRLSASLAGSGANNFATSPLNLLRGSSMQHRAAPSVDVWHEHVGSPSAGVMQGSFLSRSLAGSEHTLPGSSGITLSGQDQARHRRQRSASHAATSSGKQVSTANVDVSPGMGRTSSRDAKGSWTGGPDNDLSLAVDSLKLAQSRAHHRHSSTSLYDGKPTQARRLSLFGPVVSTGERRPSTATSSSSQSGWFRSISSAWATLRGAPPDTDGVDRLESSAARSLSHGSGSRPPSISTENRSRAGSSTRQSVQFLEPAPPMRRGISSEASSQQQSSDTILSQSAHTPTQSLVAKPTIRRGRVPAFVSEIGQGHIPGDATEAYGGQTVSYKSASGTNTAGTSPEFRSREGSFSRTAGLTDEEKVRRRQERKEANRQRRSRDIHVLPPLLAPISRTGSSSNLVYPNPPHSARATTYGRLRTHSTTPQMFVGSAGSNSGQVAAPLHRSTTPGSVSGQPQLNGPPSPAMMRSPFQGAFPPIIGADGRPVPSPSRPGSAAGFYTSGTSPRVKGLGWGAMTSIAQAPMPSAASSSAHHHSTSIGYGHAAAAAARAGQQAQRHSHHVAHGGHGTHAHQRGPHPVRHHTSLQLGTLGMLGTHPHGHAPIAGRHSTMPTMIRRSPTPSVPEDGGEMTSQDLTSGDFVPRPNSAMSHGVHRTRTAMMPPPRARSSMGIDRPCAQIAEPEAIVESEQHAPAPADAIQPPANHSRTKHTWSYEALPGLRTYPVLQLPNREETHDVYDSGWGLDSGGLAKHLTGHALREEGGQTSESAATGAAGPSQHRKKLFYFDA